MKRILIYPVAALIALCLNFSACSKSEEVVSEKEKGKVEKITDQVAKDAVKGMNSAINKAKVLQKKMDEKTKALDETSSE